MKALIKIEKEVDIQKIKIEIPIRYIGNDEYDDVTPDFPLLNDSIFTATVIVDSGEIVGWPEGRSERLQVKVSDEGSYRLIDNKGDEVLSIEQNYVPNGIIPGKWGDYIDLIIDERGFIANWPKNPSISDFIDNDDN